MLRVCKIKDGEVEKSYSAKGSSKVIALAMFNSISKDEQQREVVLMDDERELFRFVVVGNGVIEARTSADKFVQLLSLASRARGLAAKVRQLEGLPEEE